MKINVKDLPDTSFAFIDAEKMRHFPFKDASGKIHVELLQESLLAAATHPLGATAIPKLKAAAKTAKIGEYADNWKGGEGYFTAQCQLTSLREQLETKPKNKPNDEKRELVIPLLVEGWGNEVDNNYYTPKAVTESASYLQSRRKMYLNHPKVETDSRDLRDWAASIQETWVDKLADGRTVALGRVKILDNWLWERCKSAPEEIADSIIGRGKARKGDVDGRSGNIIESIEYVRSCDFVDYGGNVPFGMVDFVENEGGRQNKQEDNEMLITDITFGMLKEGRPELVAEIVKGASTGIAEKDTKIGALETKLKETEKVNLELKNQIDTHNVKEAAIVKKELIANALKESKLPDNAKTEVFSEILMNCQESKSVVAGKEVVVTVAEQVNALIADRAAILGKGEPIKGMGEGANMSEEDTQKAFNQGMFGMEEPKKKEDEK